MRGLQRLTEEAIQQNKAIGVDVRKWISIISLAGWSSPVAREAHNLEVVGSNPAPAIFSIPNGFQTGG
jgi:hypothetical protein